MKILIIDDSPDSVEIAKARLAREGMAILTAGGGYEGLRLARAHKPDLILLDLDMPDLSGFQVCAALKADPELCMIPVIFLAGSGNSQDKVKGLDLGAVDYVTKPFDAVELQARVRAVLRTKHLQDLLVEHANIDPLTGLPNRRALMQRLSQEWARVTRRNGSLAFIMADIDYFKRVNDTYGHHIGDRMLQEVARILATECRTADLPARFGGDELAILLPDEKAAGGVILAERCRRSVEAMRLEVGQDTIGVTMSFGVSDTDAARTTEELVELADKSLYAAKASGRNAVRTTEEQAAPKNAQS